jgi:hypothetical protein
MLGIGGIHSEGLFADMGFDFGGFGFFNRLFRRRAGPGAGPISGGLVPAAYSHRLRRRGGRRRCA